MESGIIVDRGELEEILGINWMNNPKMDALVERLRDRADPPIAVAMQCSEHHVVAFDWLWWAGIIKQYELDIRDDGTVSFKGSTYGEQETGEWVSRE